MVYQILSELAKFYRRFDKSIWCIFLFTVQCGQLSKWGRKGSKNHDLFCFVCTLQSFKSV